MKAIVVRQPWATLIALGIKTIETRLSPPNGPMRPEGVCGLPGCSLERGERIAIVAGAQRPREGQISEAMTVLPCHIPQMAESHLLWLGASWTALPLGAVVCTVTVDDALPILVGMELGHPPYMRAYEFQGDPSLVIRMDETTTEHRHDQLPLGDFTPGRWGWLLGNPQPCDPIPCKGKQGVFTLPDDVAARIGGAS